MAAGKLKDKLRKSNWAMKVLVIGGYFALVYYFSWWFIYTGFSSPWLVLFFFLALLYSGIQLFGNWLLYLSIHPRAALPDPPELSVDVFVTAYGESLELIRDTLKAACEMHGAHQTWLLDDLSDPILKSLAEGLGAGYLTRSDRRWAKAGNLNAALTQTQGEVIVIFDIDHAPAPDFLEKTLGAFLDPRVGFVQVMLTFQTEAGNWVSQGASETSLEFYNPTALGMDGVGSTTLMGSNALIRRAALTSIGGYQTGLAEDLATSINLHAAGWRSVYVSEPLAPGIAPPDLAAWFTQQLKWSKGVFDLLLTVYPRLFSRLSWGQRLSYAVRMTKYWIGPAVFFHLFATIAILIFANFEARAAFHAYLTHLSVLVASDIAIRFAGLRIWGHGSIPRTSLLRAVELVYATWPIYMFAWLLALLRMPLKFFPTPKSATGNLHPLWLLPQACAILFLTVGTLYTVVVVGHRLSVLLTFSIVQAVLQFILLLQGWRHKVKLRREKAAMLAEMQDLGL